jgi:hypothetical protein
MINYKRNQVQGAIFRTFGAEGARIDELRFRLKRLLAADRSLGRRPKSCEESNRHYAFYSAEPRGSGVEVMFSGYEAFALLAAIMLMEHGLPQTVVVKMMRQIRHDLEAAHAEILQIEPSILFDQDAIQAQARPGMLAFNSTHPVILVFIRVTGSSVDKKNMPSLSICRDHDELSQFMKIHGAPNTGFSIFEFAGSMHALAESLSQTRAIKRGRGATNP